MRLRLASLLLIAAIQALCGPQFPTNVHAAAPESKETDRTVLPIADRGYQGVVERTLGGSKPDFPPTVKVPERAPNVVLILLDDAGFGNPSTFGGPVQTPTFEKLSTSGLRHNRFHVTGLCSPTRGPLVRPQSSHRGFWIRCRTRGRLSWLLGCWPRRAAKSPACCETMAMRLLAGMGT